MATPDGDVNAVIAGLLRDLASIQTEKPKEWAYKRAAAAIEGLERPLGVMADEEGRLPAIPYVGRSSLRVVEEVLTSGHSPTVDRAVLASGRLADVERRRSLRTGILSRAEVVRVLSLKMRGAVTSAAYRGDLQMHSEWSDGAQPIDQLAAACAARGYAYLAVTDHSQGLPIAHGLSTERVRAQHQEIDAINARHVHGCRVLKGLETNILADGSLDVSRDECRGVEVVLAAPHAKLRSSDDQTPRLLKAVATPWIHILAHPRGRMAGSRPGVHADWDRVFRAAAERNVAIELDGDPARQDLDHILARRALEAGCVFALDSDAHSAGELRYAETALAHARLAKIPAARIINCWELPQLLAWLKR